LSARYAQDDLYLSAILVDLKASQDQKEVNLEN
jgi:hypothetical protein